LDKGIEINILDQRFTIKGDRDEDYMKRIADYVDKKIRELQKITRMVELQKIVILAALNIADEYFVIKEEKKSLFDCVENRSKELIALIDKIIL
jgi:cell division protein ZapA